MKNLTISPASLLTASPPTQLSRENYIPPSAPILNTLWRDSDGPAWVKHPALESSVIVAETLGRELRSRVVDQKFDLRGSTHGY